MQRLIASWFGTGLILRRLRGSDGGSGTVAGVVTLAIALAVKPTPWWAMALAACGLILASIWSSSPFAEHGPSSASKAQDDAVKAGDPGWVVVDEAAGTLVAIIGLEAPASIFAFVVFRLADIMKKGFPGVSQAERLPGGYGITFDDVVAGGYGLAAGWILQTVLG